jgi:hypothetical protein
MTFAQNLFLILGFALVILLIFNVFKIYVLSKININKWIVLLAAVVVFFIPAFLGYNLQGPVAFLQSGVFMFLFLWFMELSGFNKRREKKNKIVIKPKAKPNRVNKNK